VIQITPPPHERSGSSPSPSGLNPAHHGRLSERASRAIAAVTGGLGRGQERALDQCATRIGDVGNLLERQHCRLAATSAEMRVDDSRRADGQPREQRQAVGRIVGPQPVHITVDEPLPEIAERVVDLRLVDVSVRRESLAHDLTKRRMELTHELAPGALLPIEHRPDERRLVASGALLLHAAL
jgi:hypothetical protein